MLGRLLQALKMPGLIQPLDYSDPTGRRVIVKTSPRYTTVSVDGLELFFVRESGKFDGVGAMSLDDPTALNGLLADRTRRSKSPRASA